MLFCVLVIFSRTSLSRIYGFLQTALAALSKISFRAGARLSLGPSVTAFTDAMNNPSPHSHKHVIAVVCKACIRHPENDLHPFSGLSFPQWSSPWGIPNAQPPSPFTSSHSSPQINHDSRHSPALTQEGEPCFFFFSKTFPSHPPRASRPVVDLVLLTAL